MKILILLIPYLLFHTFYLCDKQSINGRLIDFCFVTKDFEYEKKNKENLKVQNVFFGCEIGCSQQEMITKLNERGYTPVVNNTAISIKQPYLAGSLFDFANFIFFDNKFYLVNFVIDRKGNVKDDPSEFQMLSNKIQDRYNVNERFGFVVVSDDINTLTLHSLPNSTGYQIILSYRNMALSYKREISEF